MAIVLVALALIAVLAVGAALIIAGKARANAALVEQQQARDEEVHAAQANVARIVSEAETRQKEILLEAKEEAIRLRTQSELELRERGIELQRQERRIVQKEENLDRKSEAIERRERQLSAREQELEEARAKLEEMRG